MHNIKENIFNFVLGQIIERKNEQKHNTSNYFIYIFIIF